MTRDEAVALLDKVAEESQDRVSGAGMAGTYFPTGVLFQMLKAQNEALKVLLRSA